MQIILGLLAILLVIEIMKAVFAWIAANIAMIVLGSAAACLTIWLLKTASSQSRSPGTNRRIEKEKEFLRDMQLQHAEQLKKKLKTTVSGIPKSSFASSLEIVPVEVQQIISHSTLSSSSSGKPVVLKSLPSSIEPANRPDLSTPWKPVEIASKPASEDESLDELLIHAKHAIQLVEASKQAKGGDDHAR